MAGFGTTLADTQISKPAGFRVLGPQADAAKGKRLFEAHCVICHGKRGRSPPLAHRIYKPAHHSDIAFYWAVSRGVVAHHWDFGDMPPIPDVSGEDTAHIIVCLCAEQRAGGIFLRK